MLAFVEFSAAVVLLWVVESFVVGRRNRSSVWKWPFGWEYSYKGRERSPVFLKLLEYFSFRILSHENSFALSYFRERDCMMKCLHSFYCLLRSNAHAPLVQQWRGMYVRTLIAGLLRGCWLFMFICFELRKRLSLEKSEQCSHLSFDTEDAITDFSLICLNKLIFESNYWVWFLMYCI